jgi:hypothetical protein
MRHFRHKFHRRAGQWAALGSVLLILCVLLSAQAQFGGRRSGRFGGRYEIRNPERIREQEMMKKAIDPAFAEDVFTFARLRFESDYGGYGRGRIWDDDTPEADLNLIFRLFEATSLKVRPGLNFIDITTKKLADYPFVYMAGGGRFNLREEEVAALRQYLLNGGFLMVDDFWGDDQWAHFSEQLKRVFPDRAPEPMDLTHPIFHNVYPFKKQPQIPSVGDFYRTGRSYDVGYDYEQMNHDPHYYGIYDDKRRLVMLICHNNHYGDGWEHEGDDETYFDLFSLPMGYPMLLNVLTYAMTH